PPPPTSTLSPYTTLFRSDRFGKGMPGGDDLHHLFLAIGGNAEQFHLATLYQIETFGGVALALNQRLRRVIPWLGICQQLFQGLLGEMGKHRVMNDQLPLFLG